MKRRTIVIALLAVVLSIAAGTPGRTAPGDVIMSFGIPCSYPSGLASDGARLYLADWRSATIYVLSPADGSVIKTMDAPTLKPHGLSFGQDRLFVSDDHTGFIYALNVESGIVEHSFQAPGSRPTGLACAGDVLYILERSSKKIFTVLPEDGTILSYFDVPDDGCETLAFDGRYLWVSNRIEDELYMVDPENGMVIAVLDAPGPYAAGLAWHDNNLWNVDFQHRALYRLVTDDEVKYRLTDTREARVEYLWALNNYGPGEVKDLVLNIALPDALPNQELLSEISFSQPPTSTGQDVWDQRCGVFQLGNVAPGSKKALTFNVNARVSAIRYFIIPEKTGTLKDIPKDIRALYLADGSRYRTGSPYIKETVKNIVGDETNPYWIARKIYNFIIDRLHYEMIGGWDVPEVVLKRGSGSCSEYTFSFVALCRAAGLPARYQGSIVVRGDDASIDEAFHRWAQVYFPGYGWVPIDANRGDKPTPVGQAKGIGELANRFLITTQSGGGSEYLGWSYNSFAKYKADGYCKVEEDNFGFWEPLGDTDTNPAIIKIQVEGECRP
jgi:transglutaminase-like putative cysteine protease